jgi:hypothetical protein
MLTVTGWTDVSSIDSNSYASFVGQAVYANEPSENILFTAQSVLGGYTFNTNYISTDCSIPISMNASTFPKGL